MVVCDGWTAIGLGIFPTRIFGPVPGIKWARSRSGPAGVCARHEAGLEPSDLARFEETVLPFLDDAYTLARYLVRDEHDAQDVVQEAFLRALKYFRTFRGEEPRAWLLAIVRNRAHTWRHGRRADTVTTEFDEEVHSGEAKETVRRALEKLAPEFREVIVLREVNGLSYKEIAQVTGSPVGTVMSRLARARARLAVLLGPFTPEAG